MIRRREPSVVMRLKRLGSFHQCRLSFMRVLTRRMAAENWQFARPTFDIDENGVGHAIYRADTPNRTYSLVAFAHDLPPDKRSDRVIADAWDATFALVDGEVCEADVARLRENVPVQEAGRITERELTLSRANRSVRLWNHVVSALSQGVQPDEKRLEETGYLMRTTAVYGSGKFGAADWETLADRQEMSAPFQAEMLTVYLIRTFVRDLVNHLAFEKGGEKAVSLDAQSAQTLGIGNSTGLGMAPFLINHPVLLSNWISAREEALARVREQKVAGAHEVQIFRDIFARAATLVSTWTSEDEFQRSKLTALRADVTALKKCLNSFDFTATQPWDRLFLWAESALSEEGQELLISLMLEPYGALVDELSEDMCDRVATTQRIDGEMRVSAVRQLLEDQYKWAIETDWRSRSKIARAWYVSVEKLEPRLGERFEEPIAPYEQPLAPARDAARTYNALRAFDGDEPIATFLLAQPEHRHTIRRVQMCRDAHYSEISDNTIAADMRPVDMLRAKLSFFGATRFDPKSDRWVRICMYAGAPYPEDLRAENADMWVYPC